MTSQKPRQLTHADSLPPDEDSENAQQLRELQSFIKEEDFYDFIYEPRTLSALFFAFCGLTWCSLWREPGTFEENAKTGIIATAVSFIDRVSIHDRL
jgi:hypothetical protein